MFATELTGRRPATFAALAAGELDYARARAVWHATAQVGDEIAARIEERLFPRAVDQTTGQIRAKIRRLVKHLDPDTLTRRRQDAERRRDVQLLPTDDGTAHLSGLDLPADAPQRPATASTRSSPASKPTATNAASANSAPTSSSPYCPAP